MRITPALIALLTALTAISASDALAGPKPFDGRWTIEVTASGVCPVSRQNLVAVIAGSRLVQLSGVSAAGRVGNDGSFNATFATLGQTAQAGGRLGSGSGSGTWSSSSKICGGSWRAHRTSVAQAD